MTLNPKNAPRRYNCKRPREICSILSCYRTKSDVVGCSCTSCNMRPTFPYTPRLPCPAWDLPGCTSTILTLRFSVQLPLHQGNSCALPLSCGANVASC